METQEAIELLKQHKNLTCHDCTHPAMVGWCENHCKLSEAFDMATDMRYHQASFCINSMLDKMREEVLRRSIDNE